MLPALVLGLGPTGLAVVRSLARRKIPVYGASWASNEPAFASRYLRAFRCPHPLSQADALADFLLNQHWPTGAPMVLFPTADVVSWFVARHQERLRQRYVFHSLPFSVVDALINKWKQYRMAVDFGIPAPQTVLLRTREDLARLSADFPFPAVVKPCYTFVWRQRFSGKGLRVSSFDELVTRLDGIFAQPLDLIVQSVIPGPIHNLVSVCCYIDSEGRLLALMGQQKLRQWPLEQGVGTLVQVCPPPGVADLVIRFLIHAGYRGPAEVEFKLDESDGQWKLIEFNPRFWEQTALATAAGLDFPYLYYSDLVGSELAIHTRPTSACRWIALWEDLHASASLWRKRELSFQSWASSFRNVRAHSLFAADDPGPCFRFYLSQLFSLALAGLRKLAPRSLSGAPRHFPRL